MLLAVFLIVQYYYLPNTVDSDEKREKKQSCGDNNPCGDNAACTEVDSGIRCDCKPGFERIDNKCQGKSESFRILRSEISLTFQGCHRSTDFLIFLCKNTGSNVASLFG